VIALERGPHYTAEEYALLFQQGDERALAFFYLELHPSLALHANYYVQNRELAEEISSEAFIKTWKMHSKLNNYNGIRAYLYKVVQRDCQRAIQKERRRVAIHKESNPSEVTYDTPFNHVVRTEVYRIIHTALKELPHGSRRILQMYYIDGKTTGEIAAELCLSPSTIKTQKSSGLEALRKKFIRPLLIMVIIINICSWL